MDRKRQSNDRQARNRIQVLKWIIERPALEQRLVDVREGAAEQNGVPVWTGAGDRGGTQRTAAAADVFDDHRAEQRFDLFHPWPGEGVERATRRKWNHEPDRPRWIGLRPRDARHRRERGSARCQMQKISAGKFHSEPPSLFTSLDHLVGQCSNLSEIWRPSAFAVLRLSMVSWDRKKSTGPLHFPRENVTKPSRFGIFTFCSVCASIVSPSAMMPLRFKI